MPTVKQAELSALESSVRDAVRKSALAERIKDVALEADRDNEGSDFLRVQLQVKALDCIGDDEIEALVHAIERAVADLDERYADVRFADAL